MRDELGWSMEAEGARAATWLASRRHGTPASRRRRRDCGGTGPQQVVGDVCEMVLGHLSERAEHQQRGGGGERRRGVSQARC